MKAHCPIVVSAALLLEGALSLVPASARAAEPRASQASSSVDQLNEQGAALYAARDYRRAIEKFIQAYAIDPDPNLLFNIARCYEELGEVDAAIEKYETFSKTPGADARGLKRARESLAALREARDGASARPAEAPPPAAAPSPEPAQARAPEEHSRVLPWLTLGGSALFAAAGTTFYLLGASDHDEVTSAHGFNDGAAVSDMTHRKAEDLVSSGDTKKLIGGVGFGLAAALAATYVVLLVSEDDE